MNICKWIRHQSCTARLDVCNSHSYRFCDRRKYHRDCCGGQTLAFMVLSLSQVIHTYNIHSSHSLFKIGVFSNHKMNWAYTCINYFNVRSFVYSGGHCFQNIYPHLTIISPGTWLNICSCYCYGIIQSYNVDY